MNNRARGAILASVLTSGLLWTSLWSASLWAHCPSGTKQLAIGQLSPTQLEISYTLVERMFQYYLESRNQDNSLQQVFINNFAYSPLPVITGPGPEEGSIGYYLLDKHHAAAPVQLAVDRGLLKAEEAMVCVKVQALEGFHEGEGWEAFVEELHRAGIGYFGPEKAKQIQEGSLSLADAYTSLLTRKLHLTQLIDNPLRAGVGLVLTSKGLSGSDFVDYIEFFLVEQLAEQFSYFDVNEAKHMRRLQKAIWENPRILGFMLNHARKRRLVEKQIAAAVEAWHLEKTPYYYPDPFNDPLTVVFNSVP